MVTGALRGVELHHIEDLESVGAQQPDEVARGEVSLKDMETGSQETLPLPEAVARLRPQAVVTA